MAPGVSRRARRGKTAPLVHTRVTCPQIGL
jgi:hypothetical protein